MKTMITTLLLAFAFALGSATLQAAEKPNDADALQGVTQGRVVFDVNIAEPKKLPLYLMVVDETISDLEQQGVIPEVILAFRGKAVQLISSNRDAVDLTDFEYLDRAAEQIKKLQSRGVRMEACSVATRIFNIDNGTLLQGINPVGNTFVSLIGYQAQGYATIPLY